MTEVDHRSNLQQFVHLTRKYAFEIGDYIQRHTTDPYEFEIDRPPHHDVDIRLWDLLLREIATPTIIAALCTLSSSEHLKTELLKPLILPGSHTLDQPPRIFAGPSDFVTDRPAEVMEHHVFPDEFYKLLFYPSSMRRLVDMTRFWMQYVSPEFRFFKREPKERWRALRTVTDNALLIATPEGIYEDIEWSIPVVRYQEGMHGLYYAGNATVERRYHGTFFYFEPDSDARILTERLVIAPTKATACRLVGISLLDVCQELACFTHMHPLEVIIRRFFPDEHEECMYQRRVREFMNILFCGNVIERYRSDGWEFDFDAHYPELFGFEDTVDQLLARGALARGIDTIALTKMTGRKRLVSEILDVRERNQLFKKMWIQRGDERLDTLLT